MKVGMGPTDEVEGTASYLYSGVHAVISVLSLFLRIFIPKHLNGNGRFLLKSRNIGIFDSRNLTFGESFRRFHVIFQAGASITYICNIYLFYCILVLSDKLKN